MAVYLGVLGGVGVAADYAVPRRWLTPSRPRACRCRGVGVVTSWKAGRAGSAGWIWLRQMVARSVSRLSKLCTGWPAGVRLAAALASARGERAAGATGLGRVASAAALAASVDKSGAETGWVWQEE